METIAETVIKVGNEAVCHLVVEVDETDVVQIVSIDGNERHCILSWHVSQKTELIAEYNRLCVNAMLEATTVFFEQQTF